MFGNSLKDFDDLAYLTIGNHSPCSNSIKSAAKANQGEQGRGAQCDFAHPTYPQSYCFCGLLKSFYVIPKSLGRTEIMEIHAKHRVSLKHLTNPHNSSLEDSELKLNMKMISEPIVDISHFLNLQKYEFIDEKIWVLVSSVNDASGSSGEAENQSRLAKFNIFSKIFNSSSDQQPKKEKLVKCFEIKARGTNLIQRSNFLEVFSSLGNVEVFLYVLDLLVTDKNIHLNEDDRSVWFYC